MLNGEFLVFSQYKIEILPSTKKHTHTIHHNAVAKKKYKKKYFYMNECMDVEWLKH